jgi:hypothetical protein
LPLTNRVGVAPKEGAQSGSFKGIRVRVALKCGKPARPMSRA